MKQHLTYLRVLGEDVVDESFVARPQGATAATHTWKRGVRIRQQGQILSSRANPGVEVPLVGHISLGSVGKPGKRKKVPS